MNKKLPYILIGAIILGLVALAVGLFLSGANIAVLNPKGQIASNQRDLLIIATLLMLIVVLPVFFMTFFFAWKYRVGNKKPKVYMPNWSGNRMAEAIWWLIPFAIIMVLAGITWKSSRDLDPFKPIESDIQPITIHVIALQWKWLFIYPKQNIATVNYVQFPVDTPVNFEITADAPMNSFWIPQLGGQIYAMPGMNTKLHLIASDPGNYRGSSANISGDGFAGMTFTAKASTEPAFNDWVKWVKSSAKNLDMDGYNQLSAASKNAPVAYYASAPDDLYDKVIMKYMPQQHDAVHDNSTTLNGQQAY